MVVMFMGMADSEEKAGNRCTHQHVGGQESEELGGEGEEPTAFFRMGS